MGFVRLFAQEVKMKPFRYVFFGLFVLLLAACKLPGVPTEQMPFTTPDLTMTAIYSVLYITPDTPTAIVVTETLVPTFTPTLIPTLVPTMVPTLVPTVAPTATPLPTNTSIPLPPPATAIPPSPTPTRVPPTNTPRPTVRAGSSIVATFLGTAPNINGNLNEWNLTEYPVTSVVFGRELWDGADDLSGIVMVGWDTHNLYLGVEVVDEDYEQNTGGANLFRGDSLEVLLDANLGADFYVDYLSADDFQLGISPGSPVPDEDPEAYLWYPDTIDGPRSQVEIAAVRTNVGYTVELAIPWGVFEMTPQSGAHYGFAFSVSDNDIDGGIAQQSMISNVSTRRLFDPTTWGDLLLYRP